MAKCYCEIGYGIDTEVTPGVYKKLLTKKMYYAEILRNNRNLNSSDTVNDGINISNSFSIVADPFATDNIYNMLYIVYMGVKWKISTVDIQYPRLILNVGGVYNGEQA
jgi:hypothetical protein